MPDTSPLPGTECLSGTEPFHFPESVPSEEAGIAASLPRREGAPLHEGATRAEGAAPPAIDGAKVRRRELLNLLNLANFLDTTVRLQFVHRASGSPLVLEAMPLPCDGETLSCRWLPGRPRPRDLAAYEFEHLVLAEGQGQVLVKAALLSLDAEGARLRLPDSGRDRGSRSMERHPCGGVEARVLQTGLSWEGRLVDFSAASFLVELAAPSDNRFSWINPESKVTVLLSAGGELLWSGDCAVVRSGGSGRRRELALAPSSQGLRRYRGREVRCHRQRLLPSPLASFVHPLTGKTLRLKVEDISGGGIAVEEFFDHASLIPGLLIPELRLELADRRLLACKAQVLYANVRAAGEQRAAVRCGLAFLDLEPADQARLSALIHQSVDGRLQVCGATDLDELWRFLFESGFVYPAKYLSIEGSKEEFKRTYRRLYLESPTIARHFLFRDRGQLFGHMSMVRYYPESWIIHHHAASRSGYGLAGVKVLDEVGRFSNDFRNHPSAHLGYLMCYYRPENRFPARVFGGVVRDMADPKGSSADAFAYLRLPPGTAAPGVAFQLFPARPEDLSEAARRYEALSGGLSFAALGLSPDADPEADRALSAEFARQGFRREREAYALRRDGRLQALLVLTLSDAGLNLSSLTSCAHAFVLDPDLDPEALLSGLKTLAERSGLEELPVLAFPADYVDGHSIPHEKKYLLWVLDTARGDSYFASVRNTFRRVCGEADGQNDRA